MQEKCHEQQKLLDVAFIDLTKAFEVVSCKGLSSLLKKIGFPRKLLNLIASFHEDTYTSVCFNGATSDTILVSNCIKQGCVVAPLPPEIFFSLLLQHAFAESLESVYLHTRSDGNLYNIAHVLAKTKVKTVCTSVHYILQTMQP